MILTVSSLQIPWNCTLYVTDYCIKIERPGELCPIIEEID